MGASFTLIGMSARSAASADGPPGCRGFCASAVHSVATGSQLAEQVCSEGPERIVQQAQMTGGMGSRPMDGGTGRGDLGIARAILALVDRPKRRKATKSRSP